MTPWQKVHTSHMFIITEWENKMKVESFQENLKYHHKFVQKLRQLDWEMYGEKK